MKPTQITFIYECDINDVESDEWTSLYADLAEFVAGEPGTTAYRCHPASSGDGICLYEEYSDSNAAIAHMHGFGPKFGERFMQAVTMRRVLMIGSASPELAELVAPMFSGVMPDLAATAYSAAQD